MAWDGNGNFLRLYSWVTDKANGVNPSSSRFDNEDNGFASAGFGNCITRDGQGKASASQLPGADASYDLGSTSQRWRNLLCSGYGVIGGSQISSFEFSVTAPNVAGASFGQCVQGGTNASDYCWRLLNAPGTTEYGRVRGDGSGALGYNGSAFPSIVWTAAGAVQGYGVTAAANVDMTPDKGSFTGTLSGMTSATTGTFNFMKMGNSVTLYASAAISGTSNSNAMNLTGMPAEIIPAAGAASSQQPLVFVTQQGVTSLATISPNSSGTWGFTLFLVGGTSFSPSLFGTSGGKGVPAGFQFTYSLV